MPEATLPELKGVRSAPVPGFTGIRADEDGGLWRWTGEAWERFGTAPGNRVTLRDDTGANRQLRKARLIAAAWYGERPPGWAVGFFDGNGKNLYAANLRWSKTKPGYPRRLAGYQQDAIRARAERGEKLTALAREFKVNIATICAICKNYQRRGASVAATRWLTPDERREILRLSRTGLKQAVIAKRFKRCVNRVRAVIREEAAREEAERGNQS